MLLYPLLSVPLVPNTHTSSNETTNNQMHAYLRRVPNNTSRRAMLVMGSSVD